MIINYAVGNQPYNLTIADKTGKLQYQSIYHKYIDLARLVANHGITITPARFLFNSRSSNKINGFDEWCITIMDDPHFFVTAYYADSKLVFPSVDIKGGVAITHYDNTSNNNKPIGAGQFAPYPELSNIKKKVLSHENFKSISSMIGKTNEYKFSSKLYDVIFERAGITSSVIGTHIGTNTYSIIDFVFNDDNAPSRTKIIMRVNGSRVAKWLETDFLVLPDNHRSYRVFLAEANKKGAFGESFSTPFVAEPLVGHSATFFSIGNFDNIADATNCLKYIKTKFARALLSTLRCTQHCGNAKNWSNVPQQNFCDATSDIDWSASIDMIDKQLYKKYGLNNDEIKFIETNSEPMH